MFDVYSSAENVSSGSFRPVCAIVLDLRGFSGIVDRQVEADIRHGTERIFDFIQHHFSELEKLLAGEGFGIFGFTGDGVVAVRDRNLSDLELDDIAHEIAGLLNLDVKIGKAVGDVVFVRYQFEHGEDCFCLSPVIADAYENAKTYTPRSSGRTDHSGISLVPESSFASEKLISAVLEDRSVLVFVFQPWEAQVWPVRISMTDLLDQLSEILAPAGRLDGVSQDEKGIIIRCSLTEADDASWLRILSRVQGLASELELDAERLFAGRSEGLLYSAPFKIGGCHYSSQGGAINKACKTLRPLKAVSEDLRRDLHSHNDLQQGSVALLGSQQNLSTQLTEAVLKRTGSLQILSAEPGGGKTTILEHVAEQLSGKARLISLTVQPRDQVVPFQTMTTVLKRLKIEPLEGWKRSTTLFFKMMRSDPVKTKNLLLLIDDLHWCDPDSLKMLTLMVSQRVVDGCLAGMRPVGLTRLDRRVAHDVYHLPALTDQDIDVLYQAQFGKKASPDTIAMLMQASDGNLYGLTRLLSDMAEGPGDQYDKQAVPFERSVGIVERARKEAPNAVAAMRVLALADGFPREEKLSLFLSEIGIKLAETDWAFLAKNRISRYISVGDGKLAISHRLLSDNIRDAIPVGIARNLHQRLARFRARHGYSRSVVAQHWFEAGAFHRAAFLYAQACKDAYDQSAFRTALALIDRWRACAQKAKLSPGITELEILAIEAACYELQGEMRQVRRTLDTAMRLNKELSRRARSYWTGSRRERRYWALGMISSLRQIASYFTGSNKDLIAPIVSLIVNPFGLVQSPAPRSRLLLMTGMISATVGLPSGVFMNAARRNAERTSRVHDVVTVSFAEVAVCMLAGAWREAEDILMTQLGVLQGEGEATLSALAESLLAVNALLEGDTGASRKWFQILGERSIREQNRFFGSWAEYGQAECDLWDGAYVDGLSRVNRALALMRGNMDRQSHLISLSTKTALLAANGDVQQAECFARYAGALGAKITKSNVGSLNGFAFPIWHTARYSSVPFDQKARQQLKNLSEFARLFPIAQPRLSLTHGLLALRRGKRLSANVHFERGLKQAHRYKMKREIYQAEHLLEAMTKGEPSDAIRRLY